MSVSRLFGTTREERRDARSQDELAAAAQFVPAMATTVAMPPATLWAFLIQMGCDRAGFYSWDRLDNGGRRSAFEIHPEWQDLAVGDRVSAAPDASVAFEVIELDLERALTLRLSLRLPSAEPFDPRRQRPRAFVNGTWTLRLSPTSTGGTRLLSTMRMGGRPRWFYAPLHLLVVRPAHWVMQRKQFVELQRRAGPTG